MPIDKKKVKEQADETLKKYGLSIPVPVMNFADSLGIKLKLTDEDEIYDIAKAEEPDQVDDAVKSDVIGFFDKEKLIFYLNKVRQNINRMRFTVAHELGHYFLHLQDPENHFRKVTLREDVLVPDDPREVEANYFAGYLLMPDSEIKRRLPLTTQMLGGDFIIRKLSKTFAVSPESMRIRMKTFKKEYPAEWERYDLSKRLF